MANKRKKIRMKPCRFRSVNILVYENIIGRNPFRLTYAHPLPCSCRTLSIRIGA